MTGARDRELDIVVFGATGFTGGLTAEYLAAQQPAGTRWAVAGRSRGKLEALRDRLGVDVAIMEADVEDEASVRRLAEASRVVITTVGPYIRYGEPLVAACAQAGTDYVDLTGEPEFVDLMYLRYHAQAQRSGARLVHACGFDSIPSDLGALFTVEQLPGDAPTRKVRAVSGRPGYDRAIGTWVLPLPTIDPQIVVRSAGSLDRYGPDFSYSHFAVVGNPFVAAGVTAGVAATFALAQLSPTRRLLGKLRPPGAGPTPEQRQKGWFRVRFVADGGDRTVVTEVSGGDPGYGETSKMLAESALSLAHDQLPETAGQVTTAVAMGDALRTRLERAGIRFRVVNAG